MNYYCFRENVIILAFQRIYQLRELLKDSGHEVLLIWFVLKWKTVGSTSLFSVLILVSVLARIECGASKKADLCRLERRKSSLFQLHLIIYYSYSVHLFLSG